MMVYGKNFLSVNQILNSSPLKIALGRGCIRHMNSSKCLKLCIPNLRYLSTASEGSSNQSANLQNDRLKRSRDFVASIVNKAHDNKEILEFFNFWIEQKYDQLQLRQYREELWDLQAENHRLKMNLELAQKELSMVKLPVKAKLLIEFMEMENELSDLDRTEEGGLVYELGDRGAKEIKKIESKWLYLLSWQNPKFHLEINQSLLQAFEKKNISVEEGCRAIAVISKYTTASKWRELYDIGGNPLIMGRLKKYDDVVQCLFQL